VRVIEPEAPGTGDTADAWLTALEARHLADLRPSEVARALRALSSAYVERRDRLSKGAALDGAGKRAAFALFYGPFHFLIVRAIVRALGAADGRIGVLADLGCGTGVAGAAWALECVPRPRLFGLERHPWAADEARWTYRALGLDGDIRCGDITRVRLPGHLSAVVAAYTVNELPADARGGLLREILAAHARGIGALIVEPIAKSAVPWWPEWAAAIRDAGGREDEWRFPVELPGIAGRLGRAAGLDHRELTARSLYLAIR
jgi:hypothetical protein